MFEAMVSLGLEIKERYPGIYYITGKQAMFDTQIVVTRQLDKETHRTSRILSRHVQEEDVRAFVEKAVQMTRQETLLEAIKNLMDTTKWTAEQAMAAMKIPDADRRKYISKL